MKVTNVGPLCWVALGCICLASCDDGSAGTENAGHIFPMTPAPAPVDGSGGIPSSSAPIPVIDPPPIGPSAAPDPATAAPAPGSPPIQPDSPAPAPIVDPGVDPTAAMGENPDPIAGAPSASEPDPGTSDNPTGDGAPGSSAPPPNAQPEPTCNATSTPGDSSGTIASGGEQRSYLVHVPSTVEPSVPAPLVIWFHGILGSSQDYRASGFREVADREGFVLVAPNGIDSAWNVGPCCTARRRNIDDVAFAKALVEKIKESACIDPRRVYAAGFSMGGGMSHYLACHAADVFAAVAPSAFDLLKENIDECTPARPISVASFRNRADNFVYYDGTPDSTPPNTFITQDVSTRINILGAEATFDAWGEIDGCTDTPVDDGPGCRTFKTCEQGTEVTLCAEDDFLAGHHPGPADQMWERLKRFSMP